MCKGCASRLIIGSSILFMILSVVILGVVGYFFSEIGDELDQFDSNSPLAAAIAFGVFMFFFSITGLLGAMWHNKCLLFIFLVSTGLISVILVAFGAVVLSLSGDLDTLSDKAGLGQTPAGNLEEKIQTFGLATFAVCCTPDDENNGVADLETEQGLLFCSNNIEEPCVPEAQEEFFNDVFSFLDDGSNDAGTCQLLQGAEFNGVPLINGDNIGTGDLCGNANIYLTAVTDFVNDNILPIGITNVVLGVLMIALNISSWVLMCTSKEELTEGKQY